MIRTTEFRPQFTCMLVSLVIAGCANQSPGPQGEAGPPGGQGPRGLPGEAVGVFTEPQGTACAAGGVRIESATEKHYVCSGSPDSALVILQKVQQVDGVNSQLDADKFDGLESSAFQKAVGGSCANGISEIYSDGGVACAGPELKRIILVGGTGTPGENGNALRGAVAQAAAVSLSTAPTVVLLEPGTYDLGSTSLNITGGARVRIHGTGREAVTITGANTNGTIRVFGSTLWMEHLTLQTTSSGGGSALALWLTNDATGSLRDVRVFSSGGPWAINLSQSATPGGSTPSLLLENSEVDARFFSSAGGDAIAVSQGSFVIRNSQVVTQGPSARAFNVSGGNGQNRAVHSQVVGGVVGTVTCFGSYNSSFGAVTAGCQ